MGAIRLAANEQRDADLCKMYTDNLEVSLADLAENSGLGRQRIRRILRAGGVTIRPEPRGLNKLHEMYPLSPGHVHVGQQINFYLLDHPGLMLLAEKVKISKTKLSYGREGKHDFTMAELQRLNDVVGLGLPKWFFEGMTAERIRRANG